MYAKHFSRILIPRYIYGTARTHRRLNHDTLDPLSQVLWGPEFQMPGALYLKLMKKEIGLLVQTIACNGGDDDEEEEEEEVLLLFLLIIIFISIDNGGAQNNNCDFDGKQNISNAKISRQKKSTTKQIHTKKLNETKQNKLIKYWMYWNSECVSIIMHSHIVFHCVFKWL